jgi:hypothetical protein
MSAEDLPLLRFIGEVLCLLEGLRPNWAHNCHSRRMKMSSYIEYQNEDGSIVLVELTETTGGVVRASKEGLKIVESGKKFREAFASVRGTIKDLVAEMEDLHVEEGEVKFGLKALAEAGGLVVGKVGGEMNYEVTLKWKKSEGKPKPDAAK